MTPILKSQDFWSGAIFAAIGVGVIAISRTYGIGSAQEVGPGYFPAFLGAVLVLLGLRLILRGIGGIRSAIPRIAFRPLLTLMASVIAFALLLEPLGFPVTVLVSALIATRADASIGLGEGVVSATLLAIFATLVFVAGLGMPVSLWPTVLEGWSWN